MDEKELAKQMTLYADALTAFVFAQAVAFGLLVGGNPTLACYVYRRWSIAAVVTVLMTVIYFWIVRQCHLSEDKLIGAPCKRGEKIASVVPTIRKIRLGAITLIGIAELAIVIGVRLMPIPANCPL